MRKIPTIFERDWNGNRSSSSTNLILIAPGYSPVKGVPTRRLDGTSCWFATANCFAAAN